MKKVLSWLSEGAVIIFMVLLMPFVLAFAVFGLIMILIDKLSRNRADGLHGPSLTTKDEAPEKVAATYADKLHALFKGLEVSSDESPSTKAQEKHYSTSKGSISVWYDELCIGISIEGADTGYWNTSETDELDDYFWFAVGALRNGIRYRRPFIGLEQAWIYSSEHKAWAVVPKSYHGYGYTKFRKTFPDKNRLSLKLRSTSTRGNQA